MKINLKTEKIELNKDLRLVQVQQFNAILFRTERRNGNLFVL